MLRSPMKLFGSCAIGVLVCFGALPSHAQATVFRDRAAFNAASQNLRTIDFESTPPFEQQPLVIDGLVFQSIGGASITRQNGNNFYSAQTVGEITRVVINLPPGTTAVACDQFVKPMIVSVSTGESVMMSDPDTSTFVGFVSDQSIETLTIFLDFPEPTPSALVDNITYGQRLVGNNPPTPQLLAATQTGSALALDSVHLLSAPFNILSSQNFAADGRTRVTLFLVGVVLEPTDLSFVTVQAEDQQLRVFNLPVEGTARVKNLSWISQVTVRLPDALAGTGNLNISVTVRGQVSNKAPLQVQ